MKLEDLDSMSFNEMSRIKGFEIEMMLAEARDIVEKARIENKACIGRCRVLARELENLNPRVDPCCSIYVRKDVVVAELRQLPLHLTVAPLRQLPLFKGGVN